MYVSDAPYTRKTNHANSPCNASSDSSTHFLHTTHLHSPLACLPLTDRLRSYFVSLRFTIFVQWSSSPLSLVNILPVHSFKTNPLFIIPHISLLLEIWIYGHIHVKNTVYAHMEWNTVKKRINKYLTFRVQHDSSQHNNKKSNRKIFRPIFGPASSPPRISIPADSSSDFRPCFISNTNIKELMYSLKLALQLRYVPLHLSYGSLLLPQFLSQVQDLLGLRVQLCLQGRTIATWESH